MHHNRWRLGSAPDPVAELTTFYTLFDRMEMRGIWICLQSQFLDLATMVNLNRTKSFLFVLKCTKIAGGWGSVQEPTSVSSSRSTNCWIGWRWGERWICIQSQFLDFATMVNLNRTKSFIFELKCTKIVGGWGSAPDPAGDPAGGAYSAPPDPLAVKREEWERGG